MVEKNPLTMHTLNDSLKSKRSNHIIGTKLSASWLSGAFLLGVLEAPKANT